MTTRVQFRDQLRLDLDDPLKKQWSDAELERYIDQAAAEYSKYFPVYREQEFTANGTDARYPVPTDLLNDSINEVWVIAGNHAYTVSGGPLGLRESDRGYEVLGDTLVFNFTPLATDVIRVRYAATHLIPSSGAASIPLEDEEFIYLWSAHLAWRKVAGKDASLSRWKEVGSRDDNPVIPFFLVLRREFDKAVEKKLARGSFLTLRRAPRYGRRYVDWAE